MIEYIHEKTVTVFPILRGIVDKIIPLIIRNKYYFPHLKVINAADKIYKKQVEDIFKFAPVFWNNYGQTESGPRLCAIKVSIQDNIDRYCHHNVIAIGSPVSEAIQIEIRDEFGKAVSCGEVGELYYHTPYRMEGYLSDDGTCVSGSLWYGSGDLVYQDESGIFLWTGRKSQTIKINGYFVNINLLHLFFDTIDEIKCSFFLYEDKQNKIDGFFQVRSQVNKESLIDNIHVQFRKNFPLYPRLSNIFFIEKIPKTQTGKINMLELKKLVRRKK